MKITGIQCTPLKIPLREPVLFATGRLDAEEHVLIEVQTDEGVSGVAEVIPRSMVYGESPESVVAAMRRWFEPLVVGLSPFEVERLWSRFAYVEANNACKGALDTACFDIQGKVTGQPCWRLLGAWGQKVAITYLAGLGDPRAVAEEARAAWERHGFRSFKLKAGKHPERDIATARAVREAVGSDATVYLDANHGYVAEDAVRVLQAVAEYGVAWMEEPCPAEDRPGRRLIADRSPVPILLDESCRTPAEVYREVSEGTCRIVSIKTARTGFTQSRKIVAFCEATGTRNLVGTQGETGIGTLASLHFAVANPATASYPAELSWGLKLTDDVLAEPIRIYNGELAVPDRPGLGIELDPDKVRHYRVSL